MINEIYIEQGKSKLFCKVLGKGKPLVVLHGGPGLTQDYLHPYFDRLAENNLVLFYDQRGCGKSIGEGDEDTITLEAYISDLEAIRSAFNLSKISILGHSWGGFLALNYAIAHPERVEKLILSNSMPASSEDYALFAEEWKKRMAPYQTELEAIQQKAEFAEGDPSLVAAMYRLIFRTYCHNPDHATYLNLTLTPTAFHSGSNVYAHFNAALFEKSFNLHPSLKTLQIPTLILHGDGDPVPPLTAQNLHNSLENSQFVLMKNCGHFPFVEDPDTYLKLIMHFVEKSITISLQS